MEPLTLIAMAVAFFVAAVVVYIPFLVLKTIRDWFVNWWRNRNAIPREDKENIAFTIKQDLENGNYNIIQGIFNETTSEVVDGQVYETEELDEELDMVHSDKKLVIYNKS